MSKKLLASFTVLIISFIVFDNLLLKLLPKQCKFIEPDSILKHKLIPDSSCRVKTDEYNVEYKINRYGLRDVNIPYEKTKSIKRILVLGDSFTFGIGVSLDQTFPKQLEKMLNERYQDNEFQVINSGVGGYSPVHEFLYLKTEGIKYQPDIVIIGLHMNDFIEERASLKHAKRDEKGEIVAIQISQKHLFPEAVEDFLKKNSFTYNVFLQNEERLLKLKGKIIARLTFQQVPEYSKEATDFKPGDIEKDLFVITREIPESDFNKLFSPVAERLNQMSQFLNQRKIPMVIIVIPSAHQISSTQWTTGRITLKLSEETYPTKIFEQLNQLTSENKIPFLDLTRDLQAYLANGKNPDLYYDYDGHFTVEGQKVTADSIFKFLETYLGF